MYATHAWCTKLWTLLNRIITLSKWVHVKYNCQFTLYLLCTKYFSIFDTYNNCSVHKLIFITTLFSLGTYTLFGKIFINNLGCLCIIHNIDLFYCLIYIFWIFLRSSITFVAQNSIHFLLFQFWNNTHFRKNGVTTLANSIMFLYLCVAIFRLLWRSADDVSKQARKGFRPPSAM